MKLRNKLLCVVLAVSMLLGMTIPAYGLDSNAVSAIDREGVFGVGDNFSWEFKGESGLLTISGFGEMPSLQSDQPWNEFRSDIHRVVIEGEITSIGNYAFYQCAELTSVEIPNGVQTIGSSAFAMCSALKDITIPASVTKIGGNAFYGNQGFITAGPIGGDFDYKYGWTSEIPEGAFAGCTKLENIVLPSTITQIGNSAFSSCWSLKSLDIPSDVKKIGSHAFYNCKSLTKIEMPQFIESIGAYTFDQCWALESITLPTSLRSIDERAFQGCTSLKNISFPNSLSSVGEGAFSECSALEKIVIPNAVTCIPKYAFVNCSALVSVTIPAGVTEIGERAFSGCEKLTSITIPAVKIINNETFQNCKSLKDISIPSGVTEVGNYAFQGCASLNRLEFPNTVTSIGLCAFENCTGLTNITVPSSITNISNNAFNNCSGLKTAGPIGSGCSYEFGWVSEIPAHAFSGCTGLESITVPEGMTEIKEYTFSHCENLKNISIPSNVTRIGEYAFCYCNGLTNVVLPKKVEYIGNNAFGWCENLTAIDMPNSVTTIERFAFSYCGLKNVTIPSSLSEVTDGAFSGCAQLQKATIPSSITNISKSAFSLCPNVVIAGKASSYAETYAKENDLPFEAIEEEPVVPAKTPLTKDMFSVDTSDEVFTGLPITKKITSKLTEGTDYTVQYRNNTNNGLATITIEGKGNYSGKLDYTFTIGFGLPSEALRFSIARKSIMLVKGATAKPETQINNAAASIVWKSANPAVATVAADGTVTGVEVGQTTITGTASFLGERKTASYMVEVTSDVSVEMKKAIMIPLSTFQGKLWFLPFTYRPANATITVTSSDSNVVSVGVPSYSSGQGTVALTINGGGSATVTVTATADNEVKTATCTVTVSSSEKGVAQKFVDEARERRGKGPEYFGFTGSWCALFVGQCAKKVGAESIIPSIPSCINLYQDIMNKDGHGVYFDTLGTKRNGIPSQFRVENSSHNNYGAYTPAVGDLVFMLKYKKNLSTMEWVPVDSWISHVEIVKAVDQQNKQIYLVGGNAGDPPGIVKDRATPIPYAGQMFWVSDSYAYVIAAIARPNWSKLAPPARGKVTFEYHCPIDVRYTYGGEVLDSATGQLEASFGTMELNEADDSIKVTLYDYYDVDIEITGNGEGTMDLTATFEDEDGATSTRSFQNVPIDPDTVGKLYSTDSAATAYLELYKNEGEDFVEVWTADKNETATEKDAALTDWYTSDNDFGDDEPVPTPPAGGGSSSLPSAPTDDPVLTEPIQDIPFTDVAEGSWYYEAVEYVTSMGLFNGTSETTFSPDLPMTRAMLVTVLYRLDGQHKSSVIPAFSDVVKDTWYTDAVAWAVEKEIVVGYSDGDFHPHDSITREQLAVMLWRYAGKPTANGTLDSFTDGGKASGYALDALCWAVEQGIITGKGGGILDPKGQATRAEVAAVVGRMARPETRMGK